MTDFTITHVGNIALTKPMPFKFIEAKGKTFTFQEGEDEQKEITFAEDFWMCAYQTTQEFWAAVVKTAKNTDLNEIPSRIKGKHNPVEKVSWDDVQIFNNTLNNLFLNNQISFEYPSQQQGSFSLPSETQWEYAANADQNYIFAGSENPNDVAWFGKNSNDETKSIGQKQPNVWGLYDMSGNVWEWCADDYDSEIGKMPKDGSPHISAKSVTKTLRGGGYYNDAGGCRVRFRINSFPDSRGDNDGFRLRFSSSFNTE